MTVLEGDPNHPEGCDGCRGESDPVDDEVLEQGGRIASATMGWVDHQVKAGNTPFHPEDHTKPGSDYNQHNIELDADGAAQDDRAAAVEAALADLNG